MPNLHVKYYVSPKDIADYSKYKLNQLDKSAEVNFVRRLKVGCDNEIIYQRQLEQEAQGWFRQDPAKMELAQNLPMPSCKRLHDLKIVF